MADDIELQISAKDDASKTIDKVADKAEALTKKPFEVKVTADTAPAETAVERVQRDIQGLDAEQRQDRHRRQRQRVGVEDRQGQGANWLN